MVSVKQVYLKLMCMACQLLASNPISAAQNTFTSTHNIGLFPLKIAISFVSNPKRSPGGQLEDSGLGSCPAKQANGAQDCAKLRSDFCNG